MVEIQVQLIGLLFISTIQYQSTVLYLHPALSATEAVPTQNLTCQTLKTKDEVFPIPKNMLLLFRTSTNY